MTIFVVLKLNNLVSNICNILSQLLLYRQSVLFMSVYLSVSLSVNNFVPIDILYFFSFIVPVTGREAGLPTVLLKLNWQVSVICIFQSLHIIIYQENPKYRQLSNWLPGKQSAKFRYKICKFSFFFGMSRNRTYAIRPASLSMVLCYLFDVFILFFTLTYSFITILFFISV